MSAWAIFGVVLCVGLANMAYGLPLALFYAVCFLKKRRLSNGYEHICILIIIKMMWICAVHLLLSNKSPYSVLQLLAQDVIMILMLFLPTTKQVLESLFRPAIYLFIIDLMFNLSTVFFGLDPLGRGGGMREGDLIPRLGGLFGNPVYTVSVTTAALFIGVFSGKKWLIFLSMIGLLINGTQRAPLTLLLVLFVMILLKFRFRTSILYPFYYCFGALVFLVTIYSASQAEYVSGNFLRVLAWTNSIEKIPQSPITGDHSFLPGQFEDMSIDTILDYGIAESPYLQIALDFGILPAIISFYILFFISKRWIKLYYRSPNNSSYFACAAFSSVIFVDRFYGSLFGGMFATFIYCALCVSFCVPDEKPRLDKNIFPGSLVPA